MNALLHCSQQIVALKNRERQKKPKKLIQLVRYGGDSVIIWDKISHSGLGPFVFLNGRFTREDYVSI